MIKWLAAVLVLFSSVAGAGEFVVSYDGFYDRLKVVDKGQYQYARVNFYLVEVETGAVCPIESGKILTERQEYPLTYTDKAQLLLPFDKQLDKDKAVIVVTPANGKSCQLKLQIETDVGFSRQITKQTLYKVNAEFEGLLADLSGFFVKYLLSFMLPEQSGLWLHFDKEIPSFTGATCEGTRCMVAVPDEWEQSKEVLFLPSKPKRMTPWIAKNNS